MHYSLFENGGTYINKGLLLVRTLRQGSTPMWRRILSKCSGLGASQKLWLTCKTFPSGLGVVVSARACMLLCLGSNDMGPYIIVTLSLLHQFTDLFVYRRRSLARDRHSDARIHGGNPCFPRSVSCCGTANHGQGRIRSAGRHGQSGIGKYCGGTVSAAVSLTTFCAVLMDPMLMGVTGIRYVGGSPSLLVRQLMARV